MSLILSSTFTYSQSYENDCTNFGDMERRELSDLETLVNKQKVVYKTCDQCNEENLTVVQVQKAERVDISYGHAFQFHLNGKPINLSEYYISNPENTEEKISLGSFVYCQ